MIRHDRDAARADPCSFASRLFALSLDLPAGIAVVNVNESLPNGL